MPPGIDNEGFIEGPVRHGTFGPTSSLTDNVHHVVVVGAGPAGLMLA